MFNLKLTASSHSTSSQSHTNTIGNNNTNNKDEVYSSSETILNPDDSEQLSITMGDQHEEKGSPHKSLKINVMRDLKCAAKIKSAYSTKNSDAQSTYTERKNSIHNILQEPVNFNEDRPHDSGLVRRQSIGNRSPAIELPISKIKRTAHSGGSEIPGYKSAPGTRDCDSQSHDRRMNQPFGALPFRYPWACGFQTRAPSGAASPPFRDHGSSALDQGRPSRIRLTHGG